MSQNREKFLLYDIYPTTTVLLQCAVHDRCSRPGCIETVRRESPTCCSLCRSALFHGVGRSGEVMLGDLDCLFYEASGFLSCLLHVLRSWDLMAYLTWF